MHGQALASDGTPLAYQVEGDGLPLVLLAGQANNHHWWDEVRHDFRLTHQTITMDYRGTGDSGKPDKHYSTPGFAEDVVAVLDGLGIETADVYGTSMGGRTAQWLAINHPSRVRKLVLGCTTPGGAHAVERDNEVRRMLVQPDVHAVGQVLLGLMYSPEWLAEHDGPRTVLGDRRMPAYAMRRHLVASNEHDAWEQLPEIEAETLILHGDADRLTPVRNAELLQERIPKSRLHVFPGMRHAYFHEARATASKLVSAFLDE